MQDSDHAQLVNRLPPKAGLLLGVTNPFFEKSCVHWPHVLSLGRRVQYVIFLSLFDRHDIAETDSLYCHRNINSPRQRSLAQGTPAGPTPGWKTRTHRRYISKDRELLKKLEHACYKGDDKMRKPFHASTEDLFPMIFTRNGSFSESQAPFSVAVNTAYHTFS